MRPRLRDQHLPKGVYFRHGAFYKVVRGKWINLGRTLDLARIPEKLPLEREGVLQHAIKAMARARHNARGRRGIAFELTRDDLHRMLNEAGWRCAVTGVLFTMEAVNGKRPFAPSIDRIDSASGYIPGNCRVVCVAANYAMNVWGEAVLLRMLRAMHGGGVLDMSNIRIGREPLSA